MLKQIYKLILDLLPHNLMVYGREDVLIAHDKNIWIMRNSKDGIILLKKNNIINNIDIVE